MGRDGNCARRPGPGGNGREGDGPCRRWCQRSMGRDGNCWSSLAGATMSRARWVHGELATRRMAVSVAAGSGGSSLAAAAAAWRRRSGGGSLAVAAAARWWRRQRGGGGSLAAPQWRQQLGCGVGSAVVSAARRRRRQQYGSGGSAAAVAAGGYRSARSLAQRRVGGEADGGARSLGRRRVSGEADGGALTGGTSSRRRCLLIARWRDDELVAGRMAVFALLARWLDEEGPNGDGAQRRVGGGAVGGACSLLAGATTSRARWVNEESAARRMAALAHRHDVQSASGLTAVLARRRDFESASGLTAVLARRCADRLIAVGTTAMRPVWPATPLRPLEPGG